ncbi:hypothetical protein V1264_011291 [Littorina saxatilis]|uniref:Apple domain-containing protein n=1 Tax=Littorina saxatilis TaxID=31220 RepID=A0AAN9BUM7_9CAEN
MASRHISPIVKPILRLFPLILLIGLQPAYTLAQSERQILAKQQPLLADLTFTDNVLFDEDDATDIRCARLCLESDACNLFTLTETSSLSEALSCRGHSSVAKNGAGRVPTPRTRLYTLRSGSSSEFLEKPCSSNADCSTANSECFNEKCLCTPGYYYSQTGDACLASCPTAQMQDTYLFYPASVIRQHNIGDDCPVTPLGRGACVEVCSADIRCKNVVFWSHSDVCCLKDVTPLEAPAAWDANVNVNANTYAKTCL